MNTFSIAIPRGTILETDHIAIAKFGICATKFKNITTDASQVKIENYPVNQFCLIKEADAIGFEATRKRSVY